MNTNAIDLYLNFLQGDLWTLIAKAEPRPLCVLKWWKKVRRGAAVLSRAEHLSPALVLGVPPEKWLCENNGTQVDCRGGEIKIRTPWGPFCVSAPPDCGEWAG